MFLLRLVWAIIQAVFAMRADLVAENLALRQARDGVYGQDFTRCVHALGIKQVLIAPRSPWQNPYVERVIGSVRSECLDHVVVFNENHLRRVVKSYLRYYHVSRTHLALGKVVAFPEVGGLHHRYTRRAA